MCAVQVNSGTAADATKASRDFCFDPSSRRTPFPFAGLSRYDGISRDLRQAMKAGDRPPGSRSHATTTAKRPQAPKAARASSPAKTTIETPAQTEVERLALELQEARERQAATDE